MESRGLICSKCMKILEQNEYSKNQIRRGEGRICKNCLASETNDSQNVSKFMLFKPLYGIEGDKADKMICLTMHQPWASLLVYGIKRAEGRGWNTDFRGRLWIHAAAKEPSPELIASCEERYRQIYAEHGENIEITFPKHYPVSALVGCVDVVDVIPHELLSKVPIPHTVAEEEEGSPYVFLCQNYRRLVLPFSLSGDHKLWKMNPRSIMKDSISPFPIDFYTIMKGYYDHLYTLSFYIHALYRVGMALIGIIVTAVAIIVSQILIHTIGKIVPSICPLLTAFPLRVWQSIYMIYAPRTKYVISGDILNLRNDKRRSILLFNHQTFFDWGFIWSFMKFFNCDDCTCIILKKSLR
ncbi:hypothetical protein JH06_4890 [Blastocystis sp. subtype 4]|uniref:hypothetical protein n=1 Tax=Blastocystis sp. subtype 4 TaxID=944170 RepID=UPI000711AE83|nr:hypothetical protein JH06_4890 [Blastocystis sp. subtype 4]KNB41655.1 hypothetical protein JH06_4890 [Blastocystis sp. subtype 4]|eukprot:XP_014525098.1 hypothetical protein JH06_4890 [Blastocystis sp. subtype 4]